MNALYGPLLSTLKTHADFPNRGCSCTEGGIIPLKYRTRELGDEILRTTAAAFGIILVAANGVNRAGRPD